MSPNRPRIVAVFGSSRVPTHSAEYAEAYALGKLLAQHGFVVMNGGYQGTMEASARGAREAGGRTIGMLSREFGELTPNPYLDETFVAPDLYTRIREMQRRADAFIVLKGSMGTLAEFALVWNFAKIDARQRKPIVLLGHAWAHVLRALREHLVVMEDEIEVLQIVETPEQAVQILEKQFGDGR
ncbi:MAG: TIGR00730 family Rossman fold protein [Anaerolineae bacterium]|nr:TIGR00730 family Rossman fold protein [Anaerolineae bacterium]